MSGGGSGGYTDEPTDACEVLRQETTLNSPVMAVVSKLKKGDLLEIRLQPSDKTFIIEATRNSKVAGSITSSIMQRLANCIAEGHAYVAEVLEVRGGVCRVHVHHE